MARDVILNWKFKDMIYHLNLIWNIRLANIREKAGPEQVSCKKGAVFGEIDNDVTGRMGVSVIKQFDPFPSKVQFKFMVESDMGEGDGSGFFLKDFFNVGFPV